MSEDLCEQRTGLIAILGVDILADEIRERRLYSSGSDDRSGRQAHHADKQETAGPAHEPLEETGMRHKPNGSRNSQKVSTIVEESRLTMHRSTLPPLVKSCQKERH